jgi:hypothetical protein
VTIDSEFFFWMDYFVNAINGWTWLITNRSNRSSHLNLSPDYCHPCLIWSGATRHCASAEDPCWTNGPSPPFWSSRTDYPHPVPTDLTQFFPCDRCDDEMRLTPSLPVSATKRVLHFVASCGFTEPFGTQVISLHSVTALLNTDLVWSGGRELVHHERKLVICQGSPNSVQMVDNKTILARSHRWVSHVAVATGMIAKMSMAKSRRRFDKENQRKPGFTLPSAFWWIISIPPSAIVGARSTRWSVGLRSCSKQFASHMTGSMKPHEATKRGTRFVAERGADRASKLQQETRNLRRTDTTFIRAENYSWPVWKMDFREHRPHR